MSRRLISWLAWSVAWSLANNIACPFCASTAFALDFLLYDLRLGDDWLYRSSRLEDSVQHVSDEC